MKSEIKYYIAIYTHECKSYCDERFIKFLSEISNIDECIIHIVDNSDTMYHERLENLLKTAGLNARIDKISVPAQPINSRVHRNITESANFIRDEYLKLNIPNFLILESDVIPKSADFIKHFEEKLDQVDVLGGLYYKRFHKHLNDKKEILQYASHVLSGCTIYKRKVIEAIKFRYNPDDLGPYHDAYISLDAGVKGFTLANYTKVRCFHCEDIKPGRGWHKHPSMKERLAGYFSRALKRIFKLT